MNSKSDATGTPPSRRVVYALLCLAAVLPFVPSIAGEFVVDDVRFVRDNAALSEPGIVGRAFSDPTVISSNESSTKGTGGVESCFREEPIT